MSQKNGSLAPRNHAVPAGQRPKGRFHGQFRVAPNEVRNQLFDGVHLGNFRLRAPTETRFAELIAEAYVAMIIAEGKTDPTVEDFLRAPAVRKATSDVVMEALTRKADNIVIPLSNADGNPLKPIVESRINVHGQKVIPAGVALNRTFEVFFIGGVRSTPVRQSSAADSTASLPAPEAESPAAE